MQGLHWYSLLAQPLVELAILLHACKQALQSFVSFYADLPVQSSQRISTLDEILLSRIVPLINAKLKTRKVSERSMKRLIDPTDSQIRFSKLLFLDQSENLLVKLTTTYCQDVHLHMQRKDFAPKLHALIKLSEGYIVVMDYLAPPWQSLHDMHKSGIPGNHRDALQKKLKTVLRHLGQGQYVHGDLRAPNIMVNLKNDIQVCLVDFDWAGSDGQVRYPLHLNSSVKWPGKAGMAIQKSHDEQMLHLVLAELKSR